MGLEQFPADFGFLCRKKVMLRKRSRAVAGKPTVAADHSNFPSQFPEKSTRPTSFFINSPKIISGFFTNCSPEIEFTMSSASTIDRKPFSAFPSPFSHDRKIPTTNPPTFSGNRQHHSWDGTDTKGIGLALIDSLTEDSNSEEASPTSKQKRKLVLFGSQLKIQVPPPPLQNSHLFLSNSPGSPAEFGTKTPKSSLWLLGNTNCEIDVEKSSGLIGESLSIEEMALYEDYTCVISHGPNPRTTRIFGNSVVESCFGAAGSPAARKNVGFSWSENLSPLPDNFLSCCHLCKKQLGHGKDIYMYRGEKAFCSQECRCQEMLFDGVEN
ncbi:hypothetical protein Nepgr_004249 [Nepenthes gracilis]|uniref:FLZ-type domain-containing protein n=1 Tax=Nepenthes gracilis TaxID=150966 RepID=A0AAD3S101_NEPGR|nr:hypothetical protein Nepgr_004249 [Nepenthes gracilis]